MFLILTISEHQFLAKKSIFNKIFSENSIEHPIADFKADSEKKLL